MVEAVGPKVLEEGACAGVGADEGEAAADDAADDVLVGDFCDAAGEGVEAPAVQALGEDFGAGVLVAVKIGGVEGGGADKEFVFELGEGKVGGLGLRAEEGGEAGEEGGKLQELFSVAFPAWPSF